jgi:uncharacterized sporulation protein YeaH/YhbH (DUF444 family)
MSPKTDETVQKATPEAPGAEGEKTDKEKPAKSDKNAEEDLSEEDKKLKEELELCVTRLQEPDQKRKQQQRQKLYQRTYQLNKLLQYSAWPWLQWVKTLEVKCSFAILVIC